MWRHWMIWPEGKKVLPQNPRFRQPHFLSYTSLLSLSLSCIIYNKQEIECFPESCEPFSKQMVKLQKGDMDISTLQVAGQKYWSGQEIGTGYIVLGEETPKVNSSILVLGLKLEMFLVLWPEMPAALVSYLINKHRGEGKPIVFKKMQGTEHIGGNVLPVVVNTHVNYKN